MEILIKPVSDKCNLDCNYCFYKEIVSERKNQINANMTFHTVENIVKKAFEFNPNYINFGFQGGEPLLIGIEFYKKFIEKVNKYNKNNINIYYSIQTNGTLITKLWGEFLKKYNFLVGISLDGDKEIHNFYRKTKDKNGSFEKVLKSIQILKEYEIDFNILTVITNKNASKGKEIYNFFKKNKFNYLQFIPCINSDKNNINLSPNNYYKFLKNIFDAWYIDILNNKKISIRFFENILGTLIEYQITECGFNGKCIIQNVIEADGRVYPCDFYTYDNNNIGNINEIDFYDIEKNGSEFLNEKDNRNCNTCKYKKICNNGCKKYRVKNKFIYCNTYKKFYDYSIEKFLKLIQKMS